MDADLYLQGKSFSLMQRAMQFSRLGTRPRFFAYCTKSIIIIISTIILKLITKSLESSRGRGCLHNCVVVDLVKSISLDRLKGPGTLTGGGSGGQGKAQLLQFWFQEKFIFWFGEISSPAGRG